MPATTWPAIVRALCLFPISLYGLGACTSYVAATSPEDCETASYGCTLQGTLRVEDLNGVPTGVLFVGNECILVSLPDADVERLYGRDTPGYVASGEVFVLDQPDGLVEVQIEGRQVGWGNCGDVVIFVR